MNEQIVYKPWGKEIWIELNNFYCYKRVYINKGYKTSLQYHQKKLETNFLVSGKAILSLQDDNNIIQNIMIKENDHFTINPGKIHRIEAITDIILQEVSTPEVDDVIRLEDDFQRHNGMIEEEKLKPVFCILAAGVGARMKDLCSNTNKCLLPINNEAIISKVIKGIPKDYDIIIAVGYKSHLVKSYCDLVHHDRKITYVEVDKFVGFGSGPGYSLAKCKEYLQRPFYFAVSDGFVDEKLPPLDYNWIGIQYSDNCELYSTADINEDLDILTFVDKSKHGYKWASTGLYGVLDYRTFWEQLESNMRSEGEVISAFYNPKAYKKLKGVKLTWHDIGNKEDYGKLNTETGLVKTDGSNTYIIDNKIIKTFPDKLICENKIKRANILSDLVPKVLSYNDYTFSYEKVEGVTFYDTDKMKHLIPLLDWLKNKIWIEKIPCNKSDYDAFYKDKTLKRLKDFIAKKNQSYEQEHKVNGINTKTIYYYLDLIFKEFEENDQYAKFNIRNFHGDCHFDNIIVTKEGKYRFIDWRDKFGNAIDSGDLYYDLGKMYSGMLMSYNKMKSNKNYDIFYKNEYELTFTNAKESEELKLLFEKWIIDNGFSLKLVKIIGGLVHLNISALHEEPLDEILFFDSKLVFNDIFKP